MGPLIAIKSVAGRAASRPRDTSRRIGLIFVSLWLVAAACAPDATPTPTTAPTPATTIAPADTTPPAPTVPPDPADAHTLEGRFYVRYTVREQESTVDWFRFSTQPRDLDQVRVWTFLPDCPQGPCEETPSATHNPDFPELDIPGFVWAYQDGAYHYTELPSPGGLCDLEDGSSFQDAFEVTIDFVVRPTEYRQENGAWVVTALEGERLRRGVPTAEAAAAGCAATYSVLYTVSGELLDEDGIPPFLPTGGEPVSEDAMAIIYRENRSEIQVVTVDGELMSTIAASAWSVAWSPDRRHIAYWSDGVYVANADGTGEVVRIGPGRYPRWSPDGRYILFSRGDWNPRRGTQLALVSTVTGVIEQITWDQWAADADWVDDDTLVVGSVDRDRFDYWYWVWDLTGAEEIRYLASGNRPVVSPDGSRILLEDGALVVINTDGSGWRILDDVHMMVPPTSASWSPDGSRIVWLRSPPRGHADSWSDEWEVWVMNADGSGRRALFPGQLVVLVAWGR